MTGRLGLAYLALVVGTGAAFADALADCSQNRNAELRLSACSAPKAGPPKAKSVVQIAEAVDIGDARKGAAYAQKVCAECHNASPSEAVSPNSKAPPFKKIANTPGMSVTALTVWSRTMHPTMPNFIIPPKDMDDLIAYLLSLRSRK